MARSSTVSNVICVLCGSLVLRLPVVKCGFFTSPRSAPPSACDVLVSYCLLLVCLGLDRFWYSSYSLSLTHSLTEAPISCVAHARAANRRFPAYTVRLCPSCCFPPTVPRVPGWRIAIFRVYLYRVFFGDFQQHTQIKRRDRRKSV